MCKCAECGTTFKRKQQKQTFCEPSCKNAYYNRMAKRGKQVVPLLMAWRAGRSRPVAKQAFRDACRLIAQFNQEDAEAGRAASLDFVGRQQALWLRG